MNKLPITNLKKWKKNNLGNYIYHNPNEFKPFFEEGIYFNHYMFHFFIHTSNYQKEGIEIKYVISGNVSTGFRLFNSLTKYVPENTNKLVK